MAADNAKLSEHARQYITWIISVLSLVLSFYVLIDNRSARRDSQHPYVGIDDVVVDADSVGQSAGGVIPKGNLLVQAGAMHATVRVYGNTPAYIRYYSVDCYSQPFRGMDDSRTTLMLLPGTTKTFTCWPNVTDSKGLAETQDPETGRIIQLSKLIRFRMTVEYEDVFHRIEKRDFCFDNTAPWDHAHLKSCDERIFSNKPAPK